MRKSVALISAIFFIVLMATLLILALSFSTQTSKQSADIYTKEQLELLSMSGTEFALLAISGHERNTTSKCVENINMRYPKTDPRYDINISIYYIGKQLPCNPNHILSNNIDTIESNGTVIIDTVVTNLQSDEPIRYHRRTIQKP